MNSKIKIVLLKELKESYENKKTLYNILFSFILLLILYIIPNIMPTNSTQSYGQLLLMIIMPIFFMNSLCLHLINEKFYNEILFNNFQSIFTLPIKVKDVVYGKILSIFLISIPATLILSVVFLIFYYISPIEHINSIKTLYFALFLPLALGTIYNLFGLWILIRFGEKNIMKILENIVIFGFFGMFGVFLYIVNYLKPHDLSISNTIIIILTIIVLISALILKYLFNNIKKEYLYRNMEKQ
ncbi:MAG: ABC-2 transporter permease [Methanobrevibacter sp.]|jgi:ABC-type Na+ efflux pump permease subunit|nr:ABC-2 transporter permease [Methanobrevibacter sp.]